MLCEMCGENEATFHYSEVVDGNKTEHHLCSECAAKTDISYYSSVFNSGGRLAQILSGWLGTQCFSGDDPKARIVCPACRMSYGEFIKNGAFGCAECYNVFEPLLDESIKNIQSGTRHHGKRPHSLTAQKERPGDGSLENEERIQGKKEKEAPSNKEAVTSLERETARMSQQLKEAVSQEDFEEAARLRDRIRELKQQIERLSENA